MPKLLIVDDARLSRNMIRQIVENAMECEIMEAENGKKGFENVLSENPDCVITDILMPEMDGLEMIAAIRQHHIDIPVIFVTADIQASTRAECIKLGAFSVVEKPLNAATLLQTVADALSSCARKTQ